ncbi:hypothetical protein FOMG_16214 [Fusarium oxysporum f. sp. melonis 26406]|uniref:Uncharacterized protein n=1 Tax=Fusarium oxysporum f. sp. melonis 26406 TaxID=1089452 RepID=W9ZGJ5_FUSOX|nr:hypothetical protein FOMG_16214 [Fusarium oxysporum f. sp. melonis 26406]
MRFISVAAALFALTDFSSAWTKDGNGVWTANNEHYWIRGDYVHEACTVMNTENTHVGPCAYFVDTKIIFRGHCAVALHSNYKQIECR